MHMSFLNDKKLFLKLVIQLLITFSLSRECILDGKTSKIQSMSQTMLTVGIYSMCTNSQTFDHRTFPGIKWFF